MKTYKVQGLREYWNFVILEIRAASEKAAKAKFRRRINGSVTGLRVTLKVE